MALHKQGEIIICTPNDDRLEQAERDHCTNAILKKLQKENPDLLRDIVQQERERQELLLEMDKLKEAPTLHMASSALYNNDQGTKRLSPSELRRIARSAEYHQAFTNYHMNNMNKIAKSADSDDHIIPPPAAELHKASVNSEEDRKTTCSNTVKKLYQLQDKIISGGGGSTQTF